MGFLGFLSGLFSGSKNKAMRTDISKRFDLLGRTGQGSMSKVWRARDKKIGRTVCLKILDKEKTARFDARFPALYSEYAKAGVDLAVLSACWVGGPYKSESFGRAERPG